MLLVFALLSQAIPSQAKPKADGPANNPHTTTAPAETPGDTEPSEPEPTEPPPSGCTDCEPSPEPDPDPDPGSGSGTESADSAAVTLFGAADLTDPLGSDQQRSGLPADQLPTNSSPPTLSGPGSVGSTLTCTSGTWAIHGPAIKAYIYTWLRDGQPIAGAGGVSVDTSSSYETSAADFEHTIGCQVQAQTADVGGEAGGITAAVSAPQTITIFGAPTADVPPSVTGTGRVGDQLACLTGTWNAHGSQITLYQFGWTRDGSPISGHWIGEGTSAYTPTTADIGHSIGCAVAAFNAAGGSGVAASSNSIPVFGIPVNLTPPTVSGTGGAGEPIGCATGSWSGSNAEITDYGFRWRLDGDLIPGQNGTSYTPTAIDAKHSISCEVRATNKAGTSDWVPSSNSISAYAPPLLLEPPEITGNAVVGRTSTCTAGRWHANGSPVTGYRYVFLLDGAPIPGTVEIRTEGSATYVPVHDDNEHELSCQVQAINAAGLSAPATSHFASLVIDVPEVIGAPVVTGSGATGDPLQCALGNWDDNGARISDYRYEWTRSGNLLSGETGSTYTPKTGDQGSTIRCRVYATNRAGESDAAVSAGVDVPVPPGDDDDGASPPPPPPPPPPIEADDDDTQTIKDKPKSKPDPQPRKQRGNAPKADADDLAAAGSAIAASLTIAQLGDGDDDSSGGEAKLTERLTAPQDVKIGLPEVAGGGFIAILLGALIGLPVAILNGTAEKNHSTINNWLSGPKKLIAPLLVAIPAVSAAWATLAASITISFGLFLALQPGFPESGVSWPFLVGLLCGVGVVCLVYFMSWTIFMQRNAPHATGRWTLYPPFIVIAAVVVLVSRMAHFVPGLILGTVAEYVPTKPLSERDAGRRVLWTFGSLFVLGMVAWFAWIPFAAKGAEEGAGVGWQIADAALAVIVVSSMESVVFGLIPAKFMDGDELMAWSKPWWALLWGGGLFWFVIVILRPALSSYGEFEQGSVLTLGGILLALTLAAGTLWLFFHWRERGEGGHGHVTENDAAPAAEPVESAP